jgi:hypothetical protein
MFIAFIKAKKKFALHLILRIGHKPAFPTALEPSSHSHRITFPCGFSLRRLLLCIGEFDGFGARQGKNALYR